MTTNSSRRVFLRRAAVGAASSALSGAAAAAQAGQESASAERIPGASKPRNVVFILIDDLRHDVLGFLGHPFIETPHLDALARDGVHCKNAFVTTALCSPSRASVLTGQYAHRHGVADNNNPIPPGTVFFPQHLQKAGYDTALIGKWHMGGASDDPQPGFSHWVSFPGQGTYAPSQRGLNINGRRVPRKGYITDELTDYAVEWLEQRDGTKPFFLYLSHKAVHSDFLPAERHRGRYKDKPFTPPASFGPNTDPEGRPMWVKNQRNSHHGVDYPYHGKLDIAAYYRRYCETLLAVDDSVGRVVDTLRKKGILDSTLIIFTGDNGFAFGEHGLIDKRTAYEESMRVPLLARCPELFGRGKAADGVVANIDIGPTVLEAAGLRPPPGTMDGRSFLGLLQGKTGEPWRDALLYEYYWERTFPHTPTMHALRGDRFKYIRYHGLWDTDELYDLQTDPQETKNLIRDPAHAPTVRQMNRRLFEILAQSDGMKIPLLADRTLNQSSRRNPDLPPAAAPFPKHFSAPPPPAMPTPQRNPQGD